MKQRIYVFNTISIVVLTLQTMFLIPK